MKMKFHEVFLFFFYVGLSLAGSSYNYNPTVNLGYEVHQATFNSSGQYYNFSNVRYAAPPVGNLRFAPPVAPTSKKVFNDGSKARICYQGIPYWTEYSAAWVANGTAAFNLSAGYQPPNITTLPAQDPASTEDCLFLDVMVPKKIFNSAGKGRGAPVMVWIHGGGYTLGSKVEYSPSAAGLILESQKEGSAGIVWVGINYRLGVFGFLSGPTFNSEGGTSNAGLLDQRFALEWVQKYIHLFGGDPSRVTIIGESAGGGSVMHQITAYGGLKGRVPFHQAIIQSPGFQMTPSAYHEESIFQDFLKTANVGTLQEARGLTTDQLQLANWKIVGESYPYGTFTFNPAVDGNFVPDLPGKLLLRGGFDKSLRVIVGHNIDEGYAFMDPWAQSNKIFEADLRIYEPTITNDAINYISNVLYPQRYDGSVGASVVGFPNGYTNATGRMDLLITEAFFTCNTAWLMAAYNNKFWSYIFTVPPALHGDDIYYTYYDGPNPSVANDTLAQIMQRYFTNFVETGNPNGYDVPYFPTYGKSHTCLNLNQTFIGTIPDNAKNERCDWWQKGLYA